MHVKHTLQITAACPMDGKPDLYDCVIETKRVIPVETILKAIKKVSKKVKFQEEITAELGRRIGAKVTTVGYHSGIRTEVTA